MLGSWLLAAGTKDLTCGLYSNILTDMYLVRQGCYTGNNPNRGVWTQGGLPLLLAIPDVYTLEESIGTYYVIKYVYDFFNGTQKTVWALDTAGYTASRVGETYAGCFIDGTTAYTLGIVPGSSSTLRLISWDISGGTMSFISYISLGIIPTVANALDVVDFDMSIKNKWLVCTTRNIASGTVAALHVFKNIFATPIYEGSAPIVNALSAFVGGITIYIDDKNPDSGVASFLLARYIDKGLGADKYIEQINITNDASMTINYVGNISETGMPITSTYLGAAIHLGIGTCVLTEGTHDTLENDTVIMGLKIDAVADTVPSRTCSDGGGF